MFITFTQNNSGGYYIQNEDVDIFVIIEGESLKEILSKANDIFKNYRQYCPCCGERWNDDFVDESFLNKEPMLYDQKLEEFNESFGINDNAIIYYSNNNKVRFNLKNKTYQMLIKGE